uniref:sodium-dependent phosphate transporter 2-like n=1 Tax=Styela clava TaxID=7725 RepID=UPI00193A403D|nr:sodium-dependent phosphate transporter 2-like [Styela clava]
MATTAAATLAAIFTTATSGLSLEEFQSEVIGLLIVGFLIAFILAFAVGANDVANSFGTTVGAKTLTLRQACILASVFETLGAILLGAKVGETIRKGIIDPDYYKGQEELLMVGEVSAMVGSVLWQLVATFLKLPVSGTHSIVGATVGFSLVAMGSQGVNVYKLGLIIASWFISPILAGGLAAGFYWLLKRLIFVKENPVPAGLLAMPILYSCTVAINFFSVFHSGAPLLGFDKIPLWGDFLIAILLGLISYAIVRLIVVVRMEKAINAEREIMMSEAIMRQANDTKINYGKKTIVAPALETITEKEQLLEEESVLEDLKTNGNGNSFYGNNIGAGDAPIKTTKDLISTEKPTDSPRKTSGSKNSVSSTGDSKSHRWHFLDKNLSEEAKEARKRGRNLRSHSVGDHHSHVRIPPVLQLEKKVLKSTTPEPTVQELKNNIRKNFSEPSMVSLVENMGGDFFEVHINRQRRAVTIQRKRRTLSGGGLSESAASQPTLGDRKSQGNRLDSGGDADGVSYSSQRGSQVQLEEPFDDSEDEGTGLIMKSSKDDQEVMFLSSDQNSYTGAIEEGFRKLSTSQYPDKIEIKVAPGQAVDSEKGEVKKEKKKEDKEDRMEVRKIFSFLQILTACFGSFAHGGNDVSNAIGPLIALYIIYYEGSVQQQTSTPLWILLYGGIGICLGLWVWGRRVIKTMGEDLTDLTPSRGFTIELMSAVTVLAASNIGIPVSTTHCKVGAVVAVGWVRSREAVDWKIFRNIVLAWFVTVPVSGGLSALVFVAMRAIMGL